jgi:hypothetical protein
MDQRTFEFTNTSGWKVIENPFAKLEETTDYKRQLVELGYSDTPNLQLGASGSVDVEWYTPSENGEPAYPFLISFGDENSFWHVFAPDFPSAIEVTHKFALISQAAIVHYVYEETGALRMQESDKTLELHREGRRRQSLREPTAMRSGIDMP